MKLWESKLWESKLWESKLWESKLWESKLWESKLWESADLWDLTLVEGKNTDINKIIYVRLFIQPD